MLVESERVTGPDREVWESLARYDDRLALSPRLDRLEREALDAIRAWWDDDDGTGVCSVSWGKDSTVVAHLVAKTGLPIPLAWARQDPFETPETWLVRDVFLSMWPEMASRYREFAPPVRNPKRGEPGHEAHVLSGRGSQDVLRETMPARYISGVRAGESRVRGVSLAHRGTVTRNTCRPIGWWSAADVFAFLRREGLPVHPAYAMSFGGVLEREWLRVHPLCQTPRGGRGDYAWWEDAYFGDVVRWALELRAEWRAVGDPRGGSFLDPV